MRLESFLDSFCSKGHRESDGERIIEWMISIRISSCAPHDRLSRPEILGCHVSRNHWSRLQVGSVHCFKWHDVEGRYTSFGHPPTITWELCPFEPLIQTVCEMTYQIDIQ